MESRNIADLLEETSLFGPGRVLPAVPPAPVSKSSMTGPRTNRMIAASTQIIPAFRDYEQRTNAPVAQSSVPVPVFTLPSNVPSAPVAKSSALVPVPFVLPSAPVNIPRSIARVFENREESAAPPLPAPEEPRRFVAQGDTFVRDSRADFVQFLGHDPIARARDITFQSIVAPDLIEEALILPSANEWADRETLRWTASMANRSAGSGLIRGGNSVEHAESFVSSSLVATEEPAEDDSHSISTFIAYSFFKYLFWSLWFTLRRLVRVNSWGAISRRTVPQCAFCDRYFRVYSCCTCHRMLCVTCIFNGEVCDCRDINQNQTPATLGA